MRLHDFLADARGLLAFSSFWKHLGVFYTKLISFIYLILIRNINIYFNL